MAPTPPRPTSTICTYPTDTALVMPRDQRHSRTLAPLDWDPGPARPDRLAAAKADPGMWACVVTCRRACVLAPRTPRPRGPQLQQASRRGGMHAVPYVRCRYLALSRRQAYDSQPSSAGGERCSPGKISNVRVVTHPPLGAPCLTSKMRSSFIALALNFSQSARYHQSIVSNT